MSVSHHIVHSQIGRLFILSAPSGAGKTTITNQLRNFGVVRVSVSHTTRLPREGEKNGCQYFFVNRDEFLCMRDSGDFLEWAEVFGNLYGTARSWVETQLAGGTDVLLEIDVQGALQVKKHMPEAELIFVRPPSLNVLEKRLRARGQDKEKSITLRLAAARDELLQASQYDYVIINDDLERAVAEITAVIAGK
ncbi:guanylate kinase [Candidatus Persebacteraceae bacterium Df01]|jgi:guanylate kinase|uniref:Guanylate kinase n=1 Tax=Candidatus Doriopsillibacter californiensis TaxID=2970740 RepID=A0ABT7QJ56_9GAMM|nr:guanylate kinase [Candidatus Persebacteraceae bacterium Df01]